MIHLIRHGETAGNAARVMQLPETPLSERGHAQAAALGERFRGEPVAAVLCSDYARAESTAGYVTRATGAPLACDALLRERNFGALRGTPYAALETDPFAPDFAPPDGETWQVFHARVDAAWRCIREAAARSDRALVVVTHGLVCLSLVQRHLTLDGNIVLGPGGFANTSVTTLTKHPPHLVSRLDCTRHLEVDAPSGAPA